MFPLMIIRPAQIADAEGIAVVHVDAWRETYRGIVSDEILSGLSYERRAQNWKRSIAEGHQCLFVAEDARRIVGFVNAGPGREAPCSFDSEIYAIYLLRAHQRRGMGAALYRAAVQWLVEQGFQNMFLWVLAENPTRSFYERMGGVELGSKMTELGKPLLEVSYGWRGINTSLATN
jgi:ribosomal protein S18 acetylase RimI-like enzyme